MSINKDNFKIDLINKTDEKYVVWLNSQRIIKITDIRLIHHKSGVDLIKYNTIKDIWCDIDGNIVREKIVERKAQNILSINIFNTKDEALEFMRNKYREYINTKKSEIVDIKSLLEYPKFNDISKNIFNWIIYKERCKELLNVDIGIDR
ncbi:MAG: hypothetical protein IJ193_00895 [Bacilli bacterium]|nr:hypothetical protein [Bacilli bacterium]